MKRLMGILLILGFMTFTMVNTGCVGRFVLFNKLSTWNQHATKEKFLNEAIFLAMAILPVYLGALIGDAVVFNSIEFWSGKNPMDAKAETEKTVQAGDRMVVQTFRQTDKLKTMVADFYDNDRHTNTVTLSQEAGSSALHGLAVDARGNVEHIMVQSGDSGIRVTRFNAGGKGTTDVIEGRALMSLSSRVARLMEQPNHQLELARSY